MASRHEGGFTITELAVVVAIIAVVAGLALFSLARPSASAQSNSMARDLYFALTRARSEAATTGFQVRMWLCRTTDSNCPEASKWILQTANQSGMGTPASWTNSGQRGWIVRTDSWISAIKDSGGTAFAATANVSVTFWPNGSAEGRRIEVTDKFGQAKFDLRVFAATGLVRLVQLP